MFNEKKDRQTILEFYYKNIHWNKTNFDLKFYIENYRSKLEMIRGKRVKSSFKKKRQINRFDTKNYYILLYFVNPVRFIDPLIKSYRSPIHINELNISHFL